MTHGQLIAFIEKMREMGAAEVTVGKINVHFGLTPSPQTAVDELQAKLDRELNELREETLDKSIVDEATSAKRAAKKSEKLIYGHS